MKTILKNRVSSFILIISGFLLFPIHACLAVWKEAVNGVVGSLAMLIVSACGWILQKVIAMVITFAQYSDFVNNPQVKEAWKIVRDLCNMFFVLIILFIAFAVILRIESYNIKKSLPKLLLMAVLINFSRTICGLMIDFSQIIMLTFVSAFTNGQGNFHNVLQINNFLKSVASANYTKVSASDAAAYYLVAIIFMITATVVMISILVAFVMRIVMFWIYVTLSPLAFLLSSFSAGQKYASQFWGDFTKYLINGPVLAFFTWMALMVLSSLDTTGLGGAFKDAGLGILVGSNFAKFVMAIGMLVGGLMISSQIGGAGASWGANTVSNMKNRGISFTKGGAARLSGYKTASDHVKTYMAMRKSASDDRIRTNVGNFSKQVGKVKQGIGSSVSKTSSKVWGSFGSNQAKKLEGEVEGKRQRLDSLANIDEIRKKERFEHGGKSYRYNEKNNEWEEGTKVGNEFDKERSLSTNDLQKELAGTSDQEIKKDEQEIAAAKKRQKIADRVAKAGLIVGGGVLGATISPALLGVPGAIATGAYGAAAGGFGSSEVKRRFKEAGETDLSLAENFENEQVKKERDSVKEKSESEKRNIMNDETRGFYERMAAAMELVDQKETSHDEIGKMREIFGDKFQDRIKNSFEGLVQKNYVGASKLSEKPENITKALEVGALNLKDIDSDSFKQIGNSMAEGMKASTFKKQYKDLSDTQKNSAKEALANVGSYKAREKLANVDTIDRAFEGDKEGLKQFINNLSFSDIQKSLNEDSVEKRESLINNITINGELNEEVLAKDVARRLKDENNPSASEMRSAMGLES